MKHTEMPASRLQISSILNSFKASGKRHLIITGTRACGKSTLLSHIAKPHITTFARRGIGIFMTNEEGKTVKIGFFDPSLGGSENKMRADIEALKGFGVSSLLRLCEGDGFAVIDEIGYIESECDEYTAALRKLFESRPVIAVLRSQELPLLCEIKNRSDVFPIDLDEPIKNCGCVIMASGMGHRFGANKLMASFRGRPMIEWVIDATEDIFSERVIVTRHPEIARLAESKKIKCILHDLPLRSDTVRLGISEMVKTDNCMFIPGDQPMIKRETVLSMALLATSSKDSIIRASFEDTVGTPTIFPKWTYPLLQDLPHGLGGNHVIKMHPEKTVSFPVSDKDELRDIDTKEELSFYEK